MMIKFSCYLWMVVTTAMEWAALTNAQPHNVFVTSTTALGNFGGIANADSICMARAAAAGLEGPWKAIISDRSTDARDRLSINGPIVDMKGNMIANDKADLWDGSIIDRIRLNEFALQQSYHLVWSNTRSDGTRDQRQYATSCSDWTSLSGGVETGRVDRNDHGWIAVYDQGSQASNACSNEGAFYCISQHIEHNVFVTSTTARGDFGGIANADGICMDRVAAAGLDGSWKAIISDRSTDARDRLAINGPIADMNGNLIATSEADLWDGSVVDSIRFNEFALQQSYHLVWSNTRSDGTRDQRHYATACSDWTSVQGGVETGRVDRSDYGWIAIYDQGSQASNACSNDGAFYCISQSIEHTVFVTSTTALGNFGGIANADSICMARAAAAGLDGPWVAIISDRSTDARDRLSINGPIADLNGNIIATGEADLWDGSVINRIRFNEFALQQSHHLVWSNTRSDGTRDQRSYATSCLDWTSLSGSVETGRVDRGDHGWIAIYDQGSQASNACSNEGAFYCISQPQT